MTIKIVTEVPEAIFHILCFFLLRGSHSFSLGGSWPKKPNEGDLNKNIFVK